MAPSRNPRRSSGPKGAARVQRAERVADRNGVERGGPRGPGELGRKDLEALEGERSRLALEAINHGHYDWDILNNTIYYSPLLRAAFRMREEQLLTPAESSSRIHPDDYPAYRDALVAHLKGETPRFASEYRYLDSSDQW